MEIIPPGPILSAGMAVDPILGVVAWLPTPDQVGLSAPVLLRVTDTKGNVALQSFTVNVVAADTPPVITSTPGTTGTVNVATDPDSNPLTYSITSVTPAPASGNSKPLTINATTGLLTWTPLPADLNTFTHYPASPRQPRLSDPADLLLAGDGRGGQPPARDHHPGALES